MASKIYTKKGDEGYTSVMGTSKRLAKDDFRIEAIGNIDELNSYVGMIRSNKSAYKEILINYDEVLNTIQNDLFSIGASLADTKHKNEINVDVDILESSMDNMSKLIPPLKNFILPTGNTTMCYCHLARTVCRRAERSVVTLKTHLKNNNDLTNIDSIILKYINRLSDYFFVLARYIGTVDGVEETIWQSKN